MISLSKTWEELEEIQPIALKMIKNSIRKNRLAHAYLFEGMRGTGKKETGLVLAKSLFCLAPVRWIYSHVKNAAIVKELIMGIILIFILLNRMDSRLKNNKLGLLQEEFSKIRC